MNPPTTACNPPFCKIRYNYNTYLRESTLGVNINKQQDHSTYTPTDPQSQTWYGAPYRAALKSQAQLQQPQSVPDPRVWSSYYSQVSKYFAPIALSIQGSCFFCYNSGRQAWNHTHQWCPFRQQYTSNTGQRNPYIYQTYATNNGSAAPLEYRPPSSVVDSPETMARKRKTEEEKRVAAINQVRQKLGAGFPARGQAMLEKMGWAAGRVLGAEGQGIAEPIIVQKKVNNFGLDYKPPKGGKPKRSVTALVPERLTGANAIPLGERKSSAQLRPVDPQYAVQKFDETCVQNNIAVAPVSAEQKLQAQINAGRSLLVNGKPRFNSEVVATPGFVPRKNVRKNLIGAVKLVETVGRETETNATTINDITANAELDPAFEEPTLVLNSTSPSPPQAGGPKKRKALATVKLVETKSGEHTFKVVHAPTDEVTTFSDSAIPALSTNDQSQERDLKNHLNAYLNSSPVKPKDTTDPDDIVWDDEIAYTSFPVSPSKRLKSSSMAPKPDNADSDATEASLDALVDSFRSFRISPERTRRTSELNSNQARATKIQINEPFLSPQQPTETPVIMRSVNRFWDSDGAAPTPERSESSTTEHDNHAETTHSASSQAVVTTMTGDCLYINGPPPAQPSTFALTGFNSNDTGRIEEAVRLLEDAMQAGRWGPTEDRLEREVEAWYAATRSQRQRTTNQADDGAGERGRAGAGEDHSADAPDAGSAVESAVMHEQVKRIGLYERAQSMDELIELLEVAAQEGRWADEEAALLAELEALSPARDKS
ncbi:hypothetical protein LTS18_014169 [Coniosporium uncinatum]|uniref:Uncharacterized protein n=1 Tax=Coniosporium uncinatum TaxID=93489 RepID=A0ACC3D914_9PEZI|nr:hypothetical protein LTS18_014169 [Coniosporium uncinatum]